MGEQKASTTTGEMREEKKVAVGAMKKEGGTALIQAVRGKEGRREAREA